MAVIANSILYIGWGVGGMCLTYLADKFGRKRILFSTILVCAVIPWASAFANNVAVFIIGRAITGCALVGLMAIFVLATENVGPRFRSLSGTIIWGYGTFSRILMTVEASYLLSWKSWN